MDSLGVVTQIWDLVETLESIPAKDWYEQTINAPESAASLQRALEWVVLRANQAKLELQRMKH